MSRSCQAISAVLLATLGGVFGLKGALSLLAMAQSATAFYWLDIFLTSAYCVLLAIPTVFLASVLFVYGVLFYLLVACIVLGPNLVCPKCSMLDRGKPGKPCGDCGTKTESYKGPGKVFEKKPGAG